jgi:hypothetical protein
MGSTSTIVGEVVVPTFPAEVPTPSAVRGGESALVSATGGEVTTPSAVPRGGVAMRASSTSVSLTTCGSDDLVWEGDDGETGTSCGLATGLHDKIPRQNKNQIKSTKTEPSLKIVPRHDREPSFRPKHTRLDSRRHPHLRRRSTTLRLQSTSEGILRRLLH